MARRIRFYVGADNVTGERPSPVTVAAVLAQHGVEGATIYEAFGVWRGLAERCTVVEVIDRVDPFGTLAEVLRRAFRQDSVLYTEDAEVTVGWAGEPDRPLRSPGVPART